ncbi:MAG TPA: alpha/beta fold hydrolase, partial [Candidatus Sulfotelmatobacter sp.]
YPYPYSAALFRRDLDGIKRLFPNHKRVVLIGHSMGGMICRLMVTDAGDKVWRAHFSTAPGQTPLSGGTRKMVEESLLFNHRPDVQRVIFIATPHRGSRFAAGWIGRIGSALVRTPRSFASIYASAKPLLIADPAASTLKRMPNSIDTLEPTIVSSNRSTSCRSRQTFPITRSLETVAGATHRIVRMASSRTGAPILMVRSRNYLCTQVMERNTIQKRSAKLNGFSKRI